MSSDPCSVTDRHIILNDRKRPHMHTLPDHGLGLTSARESMFVAIILSMCFWFSDES